MSKKKIKFKTFNPMFVTFLNYVLSAYPDSSYYAQAFTVAQRREIQLRSVTATLEGAMDIQGILGIDSDVRTGFQGIKVHFDIDADATQEEIEAIVAQSQKRSAVFDVVTNPTNISVEVN